MASGPKQRATRTKVTVQKVGFDPFEYLLELAKNVGNDREERIRLSLELLPYLRPKLRSTEVSGNIDADVIVRIVLGED